MSTLQLDQNLSKNFNWSDNTYHLGFILPEAKLKIADSLKYLSKETIKQRFFSYKNGFSDGELRYLTEIDGINHFAVGIETTTHAPTRSVGIARMVRELHDFKAAEIAIVIVDDYQRMGFGSFFIHLCIVAARERNINSLHFSYLPENEGIKKLITKFAPLTKNIIRKDFEQSTISINDTNYHQSVSFLKNLQILS